MDAYYLAPRDKNLSYRLLGFIMRSKIIVKIFINETDDNRKILKIEFCEANAKNRFITFIPERYQSEIKIAKPIAFEQVIDVYAGLEQEYKIRIVQKNLGRPQLKNTNNHNLNHRGFPNQQPSLRKVHKTNQNFPNNEKI